MDNYGQKSSLNDQKLNNRVARGGSLFSCASPSLILGVAAVVCSLAVPSLTSQSAIATLISLLICAICALCAFVCIKRFLILAILAVLASFIVSLAGSTVALASIIGPIFSIAFTSSLISRKDSSPVLPMLLIPLASYTLSLAITGDLIVAFSSLYTLPAAFTLGICNRRECSKSTATLSGTIAFTVVTVTTIAGIIYATYGALTPQTIKIAADDLAYTTSYYCEVAIDAAGNAVTPEIKHLISYATDTFINILPGIIVAFMYITAYVCQSVSVTLTERMGYDTPKDNYITADICTAVIFIIAYILSFSSGSTSSGISLEGVVGSNITLMLTPCLFIVGLRSLKLMPHKLGFIGLLFSIGTFVLIFVAPSSAFTVFALAGAIYILISSIDTWAKQHYSKGENK